MTDDAHGHHSTIAVLVDRERELVTITLECDVCGRVVFTPIAIEHVMTLAAITTEMAEVLELQPGTFQRSWRRTSGGIDVHSFRTLRRSRRPVP